MDEATEYKPISVSPPTAIKKDRTKLIIFLIIAIILVGGYFFFRKSGKEESATVEKVIIPTVKEKVTPTPEEETPTPEEETEEEKPTASPIPTSGKIESAKDLNIQILNGSGEVGVAGKIKTYLSDKGYKNLYTGNADNYDFENVTINIKDSRKTYTQTIKDDLSSDYTINDNTGVLSSSSEYDVQIIIGK
jgi:hypothetical protein